MFEQMGEKPKTSPDRKNGKMHYLDNLEKKKRKYINLTFPLQYLVIIRSILLHLACAECSTAQRHQTGYGDIELGGCQQ